MKRAIFGWLAVSVVALTVSSALAQNTITLGGSTSGFLAFVAEGGGDFSLNLCSKLNFQKMCVSGDTMTGLGTGNGIFSGDNGVYVLTGTNTIQGDLTGCVGQTCSWTLTGGTWNFDYRNLTKSTDYLNGTLTLVSLTETPQKNTKLFQEVLTFNLSIKGGTLATLFSTTGGVVTFNVQTLTTKSLAVTQAGRGIQGTILDGSVTPTPEPGTMALVGSGLVLLGGLLRRKFGA